MLDSFIKLSWGLVVISSFTGTCALSQSIKKPEVISVEKKEIRIPASRFFSKIDFIPLQTDKNCLITNIQRIVSYDKYFYILANLVENLYIFDHSGRFIGNMQDKWDQSLAMAQSCAYRDPRFESQRAWRTFSDQLPKSEAE